MLSEDMYFATPVLQKGSEVDSITQAELAKIKDYTKAQE